MVEQSKDRSKVLKECLMSIYPQCNFYIPCEVAPAYDMPDSYYMGLCVSKLMDCDTVIACSGWKGSRGCQCEKFIAETYGIEWSTLKSFCLKTMDSNNLEGTDFYTEDEDSDCTIVTINIDEGCNMIYNAIWKELQKHSKFDGHIEIVINCGKKKLDEDVLAMMFYALICSNKNLCIHIDTSIYCHKSHIFSTFANVNNEDSYRL